MVSHREVQLLVSALFLEFRLDWIDSFGDNAIFIGWHFGFKWEFWDTVSHVQSLALGKK